jgi:hypothetical protein
MCTFYYNLIIFLQPDLLLQHLRHNQMSLIAQVLNYHAFQQNQLLNIVLRGIPIDLQPLMAPIHFELIETAVRSCGYNLELLRNCTQHTVETGLKYVNNDACYPSILVTGQMIEALESGKYDLNKTALIMSQTGGGCRATNYIGFIRKALKDAGFANIPVISFNVVGMEKMPGFKITPDMVEKLLKVVVYGDLLQKMLTNNVTPLLFDTIDSIPITVSSSSKRIPNTPCADLPTGLTSFSSNVIQSPFSVTNTTLS